MLQLDILLKCDPNIRHGSLFGKSIGSNKRSVPNKRTVSSNWNTRITKLSSDFLRFQQECTDFDERPLLLNLRI